MCVISWELVVNWFHSYIKIPYSFSARNGFSLLQIIHDENLWDQMHKLQTLSGSVSCSGGPKIQEIFLGVGRWDQMHMPQSPAGSARRSGPSPRYIDWYINLPWVVMILIKIWPEVEPKKALYKMCQCQRSNIDWQSSVVKLWISVLCVMKWFRYLIKC